MLKRKLRKPVARGRVSPAASFKRQSDQEKAHTSATPRFAIAIMAAGKGTRLKSRDPKVLHRIGGKALLEHVVAAAMQVASSADIFAVVGHEADRVSDALRHTGINFV